VVRRLSHRESPSIPPHMMIQSMPRYLLLYFSRATEKPRITNGLYTRLKHDFIVPQFRGLIFSTLMRLPGNGGHRYVCFPHLLPAISDNCSSPPHTTHNKNFVNSGRLTKGMRKQRNYLLRGNRESFYTFRLIFLCLFARGRKDKVNWKYALQGMHPAVYNTLVLCRGSSRNPIMIKTLLHYTVHI
jgi:hypothetical protein